MSKSSSSFGGNMISVFMWITFGFVSLKCYVCDLMIENMYRYSLIFLITFSVLFFLYLLIYNIMLTENQLICGSTNIYLGFTSTLFPYIFIYVLGISALYIFPGWLRSFSNTFGLSIIRMSGYSNLMAKLDPPNENQQSESERIYKAIYQNPDTFINELDLNKKNIDGTSVTLEEQIPNFLKNKMKNIEINQLEKYITMKETIGTYIWVLLLGIFTILTSQNTLLNENCTSKITDDPSFKDYITTQLGMSS